MRQVWRAGPDVRSDSNPQGEKATYVDYLTHYRYALRATCDGLTPQQLATRSVPPSTLSLLGLVRHLAGVEQFWFAQVAQGVDEPRPFRTADDRDHDFNAVEPTWECVDEAFARWDHEAERARAWLESLPEADLGVEVAVPGRGQEVVSMRDLLVHMIEEYARHCGHADLLRESIDGRTEL